MIVKILKNFEDLNDKKIKKDFINEAIDTLNEREKTIIRLRKFKEKSITLDNWENVKNQ